MRAEVVPRRDGEHRQQHDEEGEAERRDELHHARRRPQVEEVEGRDADDPGDGAGGKALPHFGALFASHATKPMQRVTSQGKNGGEVHRCR